MRAQREKHSSLLLPSAEVYDLFNDWLIVDSVVVCSVAGDAVTGGEQEIGEARLLPFLFLEPQLRNLMNGGDGLCCTVK